ncbi:MAG: hypothetical protein Q4D14_07305 [Bacteroidales bacterium]|nr:hypothetical protein [Bacteroidales bacterium]
MVNKLPKICLWVLFGISVIFALMFALGGSETVVLHGDEFSEPTYTNMLLYWTYFLAILAVAITLVVSLFSYAKLFKKNSKRAIAILAILVVFALIFVISWAIASPEKINIIGYEGTDNVGNWARYSEMCLYVCYVLAIGAVLAIAGSSIYKAIKK